ncbi:hypothetical protein DFH09DRAFT_1311417 [Mycena vulgaris]|nr:hypothetical protein DFH09DRAFT_1311417 [Mycena vulgaris]
MPAELTVAPRLRQELPHIPHPHPYPILTPYPQFKAARKPLPADLHSKEERFFYFVVDSAFRFPFDSTSEMAVDPDDISDLPDLNSLVAQEPLEPYDDIFAVRNWMAPQPKSGQNLTSMALWSHSPAKFAHAPRAIKWLQWLLRKLSIYAAPNAPLKCCHHCRICDPVSRVISRL